METTKNDGRLRSAQPSDRQVETMSSLEERTDAVLSGLAGLVWMPGFPDNEASLKMIAKVVAKFVAVEPDPIVDATVSPLAWLLEEIATEQTFFPKPIEVRKIYQERYRPLDGRSAAEMGS